MKTLIPWRFQRHLLAVFLALSMAIDPVSGDLCSRLYGAIADSSQNSGPASRAAFADQALQPRGGLFTHPPMMADPDHPMSSTPVLLRRGFIAALGVGAPAALLAQEKDAARRKLEAALGNIIGRLRARSSPLPEQAELIRILQHLQRHEEGYLADVVDSLHNNLFQVIDPPARVIAISRGKLESIDLAQFEALLFGQIARMLPVSRLRQRENLQNPPTAVGQDSAAFAKDAERQMHAIAMNVQNEILTQYYELEYRRMQIGEERSLREAMAALAKSDPVFGRRYESFLPVLAPGAGPHGEDVFNEDQARWFSFISLHRASLEMLRTYATQFKGVSSSDQNAFGQWAVSWLRDPHYYQPSGVVVSLDQSNGGTLRQARVIGIAAAITAGAALWFTRRDTAALRAEKAAKQHFAAALRKRFQGKRTAPKFDEGLAAAAEALSDEDLVGPILQKFGMPVGEHELSVIIRNARAAGDDEAVNNSSRSELGLRVLRLILWGIIWSVALGLLASWLIPEKVLQDIWNHGFRGSSHLQSWKFEPVSTSILGAGIIGRLRWRRTGHLAHRPGVSASNETSRWFDFSA